MKRGGGTAEGIDIAVLGVSGFLGSHLATGLSEAGHSVLGVHRAPRSDLARRRLDLAALAGVHLLETDDLAGAVRSHDTLDAVIAATGAGNPASGAHGLKDQVSANVGIFCDVLEAVRDTNPSCRVVQLSTRTTYGVPDDLPVRTTSPVRPNSLYAIQKAAADEIAMLFRDRNWVETTSLKISNPYGPWEHSNDDSRSTGLIGRFIRRAESDQALNVFGSGSQRRDFVFVDDVTEVVARTLAMASPPPTVNVGGPSAVSLVDAAHAVVEACKAGSVVHTPWPASFLEVESGDFWFDPAETHQLIGYSPTIELDHGIAVTLERERT